MFERNTYSPGEQAQAGARVRYWKSQSWRDGPFDVYLVEGSQPLWYHNLPVKAVRVGRLSIRHDDPWPPRRDEGMLVAGVSFQVPRIDDGKYQVWVCNVNCRTGFGDLVYGQITVER